MFYEVSGTAAAFASSSAISKWGNNYSFFLTPVFFTIAGIIWFFISLPHNGNSGAGVGLEEMEADFRRENYLVQLFYGFVGFGKSVWVGFLIIFGSRKFICKSSFGLHLRRVVVQPFAGLFPGYALALYLHRFLESSLAPAYAKRTLGISAWAQIIVGGSNFGELLGALSVFLLSDFVTTPVSWRRLIGSDDLQLSRRFPGSASTLSLSTLSGFCHTSVRLPSRMSPGPGGPLERSSPSLMVGPLAMSRWLPTFSLPSLLVTMVSYALKAIVSIH